ncbi:hypothetical protein BH10PSE8_BH10PSE8_17280 [soil metagenome]
MSIEAEDRAKAQTEGPGGTKLAPMRADDHSNANPAEETPVEARQGFLGAPVLMVLVGGLGLAVIAWVAIELFVY